MLLAIDDDRPSDSPFVKQIWRTHSERGSDFTSIAMSHWEMVVTRLQGETTLTVRGPESRPTSWHCPGKENGWAFASIWARSYLSCPPARWSTGP